MPSREFGEALENLVFRAGVESGGRLIENQQLRVAKIGARQRQLLPFAAGEIDSAFEAAAEQLIVTSGKPANHRIGETFAARASMIASVDPGRSMRPTAMFCGRGIS